MKVLIWFLCIFFDALLYPVVKSLVLPIASYTDEAILFHSLLHGVIRGLHFLLFFKLARYLCKRWDQYKADKEAAKLAASLNISINIPTTCARFDSDERLASYLQSCIEKGLITPEQRSVLLNNYAPSKRKLSPKEQKAIIASVVIIIFSLLVLISAIF